MRWDFLLRGSTTNDKEYVCEQVRMQHGFQALFYGALGRLPVVYAVLPPIGTFNSCLIRIIPRSRKRYYTTLWCRRHRLILLLMRQLFSGRAEIERLICGRGVGRRHHRCGGDLPLVRGQRLVRSHSGPRRVVTESVRVRSSLTPMRLQVKLR